MQVPESIISTARKRILESTEERERVMRAVLSEHPLDAEQSLPRKVRRMQAATGVSLLQAEKLAQNKTPSEIGLAGEARLSAERLQGKTKDFIGISFLELAQAAAKTICRVVQDLNPLGSGFMISDKLLLTNNHIIPTLEEAQQCLIEFNYELDINGRPKTVTRFQLDPETFFLTNKEDDLDFTVVAVGRRESGNGSVSDFGYCPLINTDDKHLLGEFVNIIQHPEGDYKQIVLRENRLITRLNKVLHYITDTMPGSSGSPVFNDQWEVVALHHWGEPFTETVMPDGQSVPKDVNEGVRISAIFKALEAEKKSLGTTAQTLLDSAINSSFRHPSKLRETIS
jgi:endonuclease G